LRGSEVDLGGAEKGDGGVEDRNAWGTRILEGVTERQTGGATTAAVAIPVRGRAEVESIPVVDWCRFGVVVNARVLLLDAFWRSGEEDGAKAAVVRREAFEEEREQDCWTGAALREV